MPFQKNKLQQTRVLQLLRIIVLSVLVTVLLRFSWQQEGRIPFRVPPFLQSQKDDIAQPKPVSSDEILEVLQEYRRSTDNSELQVNASLEKAARLLSLQMEDEQRIEIPDNVQPYLASVSEELPPQIETLAAFFSGFAAAEQMNSLASGSAVLDPEFTQVGIATRSAEFEGSAGTLVVIMISPDFRNHLEGQGQEVQPAQLSEQPPTYTGADLWEAVQNYRRAHSLPLFTQANELCTVASIRLNELLELGKLDNHDGFDARAEEFFERNPDWKAINENLASGYPTAVQAVEWGWDNSLGHKALIQSTEFPKACTAASRGFAVLITGR